MAAAGEKSFCVLEYRTSKFVVTVQHAFHATYAKDPPTDKTICVWYKQFTETGCLCKQKSIGHPLTEYRCTHIDAFVARTWYRIDVCRVTCGAHIEHL